MSFWKLNCALEDWKVDEDLKLRKRKGVLIAFPDTKDYLVLGLKCDFCVPLQGVPEVASPSFSGARRSRQLYDDGTLVCMFIDPVPPRPESSHDRRWSFHTKEKERLLYTCHRSTNDDSRYNELESISLERSGAWMENVALRFRHCRY